MMIISSRIGGVANIAVSVLIAMGSSMVVRQVTATLNQTVGTVWPFSSVHCVERSSPGCEAEPPFPAARFSLARR